MKKFLLFSVFVFATLFSFSQNYIGKTHSQILIDTKYAVCSSLLEMWEKKDVYIEYKHSNDDAANLQTMTIHDAGNFKITTCFFEQDACVYFKIVYYNLGQKYVNMLLEKKYGFYGRNEWICYNYETPSVFNHIQKRP